MPTLYERHILNNPEVRLAFGDPFVPIVRPDEVTLELSNGDGYFDALDLRGELITYDRFDKFSQEQLRELTGTVIGQEVLIDRVILRTMTQDVAELQTLLPKRTVDAATFPKADPQQGLGKPIPIVFGLAASTNKVNDAWELPYVGEDTVNNYYDYLLGKGTFANVTVYRNTVGPVLFSVPSSEYAINTTAYPGFTVIRFSLATSAVPRQRDFNGGMHRIFAAADCTSTTRDFVTAVKLLLNDATFGLGLPVNAASVATAVADLAAVGGLYCDGVIAEQKPAIDWISQMLMVRGIGLSKNSAGEWTIMVDKAQSIIQASFGHGKSQQWANIIEFRGIQKTPVTDAISSLILDYRKDRWMNRYLLATTARSPMAFGTVLRLQHDFIRNQTTADKTADYLSKRHTYEDERLPFSAGQEARKLRPGDLINYVSIRPASSKTWRVVSLQRTLDTTAIKAVGWDSRIFAYTAAALPAEPPGTTATDNSRTAPTAVTGLAIATSGLIADGQGGWTASVTLQYTVPMETYAQTIVRCRKAGATNWETVAVDQATGANLQTKITGLITGASYDYRVSRVNILNASLSADATLTAQTTPADTTPPAIPSGLVATGGVKLVDLDWNDNTDADLLDYGVWRNTSNNPGGATQIARARASRFVDASPTPATTYYYWITAYDRTGNQSAQSSVASATATVPITTNPPSNPAAATFSSSSTYLAADGTVLAYLIMNMPAMPTGGAILNLLYRQSGFGDWQLATQRSTGGGTAVVDGLTPGLNYAIACQAFGNGGGASSVITATGSPFLAPGDTIAPGTPGVPYIITQHLKSITFGWAAPADKDIKGYHGDVFTGPGGTGSFVVLSDPGGTHCTFALNWAAYGTTYYFRVQAIDFSGNIGAFSGSVPFSFVRAVTNDYGDGSVTSLKIGYAQIQSANIGTLAVNTLHLSNQAVTSLKRQLVNTLTLTLDLIANGISVYDFNPIGSIINMATFTYSHPGDALELNMIPTLNQSGVAQVAFGNSGAVKNSRTTIMHYW